MDALEALHPGELAKIVEEAMTPYWDSDFENKLIDTWSETQEIVDDIWEDRTEPIQNNLAELKSVVYPILEKYDVRFKDIQKELDSELQPHIERLESLRLAVEEKAESLKDEIELPKLPEAMVNPPNRDWLYDSNRGWLDQLKAYKQTTTAKTPKEGTI